MGCHWMELFHHVASHFPPDRIKTIKKRRPEFQFFLNEINCRPIRNSAKAGSWFRALRLLQTWNNISVFHLFFMSDPVSKDYQSNGFRCGSKLSPPTETFRFGAETYCTSPMLYVMKIFHEFTNPTITVFIEKKSSVIRSIRLMIRKGIPLLPDPQNVGK